MPKCMFHDEQPKRLSTLVVSGRDQGRLAVLETNVDPGLGAKVAFLCRPESYPMRTTRADALETHMSWVFLTDANAWKLKKPVRTPRLDFTSEALRRANCEEELRLNRRLAGDVYETIVPLAVDPQGRLRFGAGGQTVDWLVRMRRLPSERMLDHLLRERKLKRGELERAIEHLSRFYRAATRADMPSERYRSRFAEEIAENRRELTTPAYGLSRDSIEATCARQLSLLAVRADLFDARAERIVEAHGDLRPEHVCLEDPPKIIDCLEFSRELRLLDPADELSFLALECARLGSPELASTIFGTYTAVTGDAPPPMLLDFYSSFRACVRARIAIRHLADASPREPARWSARARAYLALARGHIERCTAASSAPVSYRHADVQPAR